MSGQLVPRRRRRGPAEGYRGPTVCRIVGITYRQLDYWARTGLVEPSLRRAEGSGTQRLYSFDDVVRLRVVKRLLDAGVSLAEGPASRSRSCAPADVPSPTRPWSPRASRSTSSPTNVRSSTSSVAARASSRSRSTPSSTSSAARSRRSRPSASTTRPASSPSSRRPSGRRPPRSPQPRTASPPDRRFPRVVSQPIAQPREVVGLPTVVAVGGLDDHVAPAARTTSTSRSGSMSPAPRFWCRSRPEPASSLQSLRCTRSMPPVIAVEALDRAREVLAGGVRVAGVEAEPERRLDPVEGLPQRRDPVEVAGDRVAARRRCSRSGSGPSSRAVRASTASSRTPRRRRHRRGGGRRAR